MRHPDLFRGAFVAGSRASAPAGSSVRRTMRTRHTRVAFTIGRQDDPNRVRGIERARDTLQHGQVTTELFAFDGTHQLPSDGDTLPRAMRFLFEP